MKLKVILTYIMLYSVRIYWEHMVSAVPKMGVLIVLLATRTISFRIRGLK